MTNASEAGELEIAIRITPEMLEAGVGAFVSYDSRVESEEEAVRYIYETMTLIAIRQGIRKS